MPAPRLRTIVAGHRLIRRGRRRLGALVIRHVINTNDLAANELGSAEEEEEGEDTDSDDNMDLLLAVLHNSKHRRLPNQAHRDHSIR